MAKVRRVGFGTVFQVEDSKVGIGTTVGSDTFRVFGDVTSSNANVINVATVPTYKGFLDNETRLSSNEVDLDNIVGYVNGEPYYGDFHVHNRDDGTQVNMVGSAHTTIKHAVIGDESDLQADFMGGDIVIDGEFTVSPGASYCSSVDQLTVTSGFAVPTGNTDDRIHCHTAGSMRFNEDLGTLEFYTGNEWKTVNSFKDTGNGSKGYIAGGYDGSASVKTIDLINISTLGNAVEFGDSTIGERHNVGRASSRIEGFSFSNGSDATILVFTLSSKGNSVGFGENVFNATSTALASSTRALSVESSTSEADISYIEMSTRGDAVDFGGNLSVDRNECGAVSSATRGIICGGGAPSGTSPRSLMDFVTISSKGNATTFGNLQQTKGQLGGGVSDGVRGVVAGGYGTPLHKKEIDYMTIASEGNAIVFGDLQVRRAEQAGATCNRVRGIFAGGATPSSPNKTNSMEFITIASQGNGLDFGDLTQPRDRVGGGCISDSHGGLGGF